MLLGEPLRIDEVGYGGPAYQRASWDAAEATDPVPVAPGELAVTAQVHVVFAIR